MDDGTFVGFCITMLLAASLIFTWLGFFKVIFELLWKMRWFLIIYALLYFEAKLIKLIL